MGYREELSFCRECGAVWTEGASACIRCGTERVQLEVAVEGTSASKGLVSALALYFVLLANVFGPMVLGEPSDVVSGIDLILILDTLVVGIWAILHRRDLLAPLRKLGELRWWAIALAAVPLTVTLAYANTWLVSDVFGGGEVYLAGWHLLAGRSLPMVLLLCAVQPAVIEELAFRGVIFGRLSAVVDPKAAIIISAATFTLLHMSLLSAGFLMGLGLLTGWLRWKSGSLYPAIVLHLLHNAVVTLLIATGVW